MHRFTSLVLAMEWVAIAVSVTVAIAVAIAGIALSEGGQSGCAQKNTNLELESLHLYSSFNCSKTHSPHHTTEGKRPSTAHLGYVL
jgi:hypothetical protein